MTYKKLPVVEFRLIHQCHLFCYSLKFLSYEGDYCERQENKCYTLGQQ